MLQQPSRAYACNSANKNNLIATLALLWATLLLVWLLAPECWQDADCVDYPCLSSQCQCPPELVAYWRCNVDDHAFHVDVMLVMLVIVAAAALVVAIY